MIATILGIFGTIYYIAGFVCFYKLDQDNDIDFDLGVLYFILCVAGLGIVPILHKIILKIIERANRYKVERINSKFFQEGLFKRNGYLCYGFDEYYGTIRIDVTELSFKEMDKIIDYLNKWADEEKHKNARLSAIESVRKGI